MKKERCSKKKKKLEKEGYGTMNTYVSGDTPSYPTNSGNLKNPIQILKIYKKNKKDKDEEEDIEEQESPVNNTSNNPGYSGGPKLNKKEKDKLMKRIVRKSMVSPIEFMNLKTEAISNNIPPSLSIIDLFSTAKASKKIQDIAKSIYDEEINKLKQNIADLKKELTKNVNDITKEHERMNKSMEQDENKLRDIVRNEVSKIYLTLYLRRNSWK